MSQQIPKKRQGLKFSPIRLRLWPRRSSSRFKLPGKFRSKQNRNGKQIGQILCRRLSPKAMRNSMRCLQKACEEFDLGHLVALFKFEISCHASGVHWRSEWSCLKNNDKRRYLRIRVNAKPDSVSSLRFFCLPRSNIEGTKLIRSHVLDGESKIAMNTVQYTAFSRLLKQLEIQAESKYNWNDKEIFVEQAIYK